MMHVKWGNRAVLALLLTAALFVWACGDNGDDDDGNGTGPNDELTYEEDMVPIFETYNCTGCHSETQQSGGFDITDYDELVNGTSNEFGNPYVVPGEPENSELVWRVKGEQGVPQMPAGGSAVSPEDVEAIEQWITDGAQSETPQ
ncbi:hypothetical protein GF324_04250 [bacterium]|nr:hypothetical protein [bacterium]